MADFAALAVLVFATWNVGLTQQPLQVMHHHVPAEVSSRAATRVGPLPSDRLLNVSIVLPLRNQAELTGLLSRLYDPSSPDYRHFLSVSEFTERFGPTVADYQAVVSFAQSNGLTVTGTPANRLIVPISSSVELISRAFNVAMDVYQHPTESRTFFSPAGEPSLNLGVPVAHIAGLNNFSLPRPMLTQSQVAQQISNVTGSGPGGSYLGSDMRAAYYGGTTLNGNGQAVGLVEFSGYNIADVNQTFSNAGQSYSVPINNVLLDGAVGAGGGRGEAEAVLDIVQAISMAPGLSQVRVYIGVGMDDANILNSMASENIAKQLSCSWSWKPEDPAVADGFFKEFAAQGQSFFTASGDDGAFYSVLSPYFYPQEDAYVTAVGGTHLTTNGVGGAWVSETSWNSRSAGSGGGISPDNIPIPSWQAGIANSSNAGSTILRNVPDVAMEGDFDNYVCSMGSCAGNFAGTSFAAPRWAGFMALINQQAVEASTAPLGGIGFINPALYRIGSGSNYSSELHDITVGNNDTGNQPTWYNAVTGYDLVTGWGSASGQTLIDDLAGPQVPGFWILASSSTVSVNQGTSSSTTITVTDAGGFTGNVDLAVTSTLPTGVTAFWGTNPTSASSVLTLTASGSAIPNTTTLAITGTSGKVTATTNITVAVHGPTFTLSSMPSSLSINQNSSGTSLITVAPQYGFAGSVNLTVSGLPSGVTASWGTNPTYGTSVLTLTASSTATPGASTLTITGTSGSLVVTGTLLLNTHGPTFTLSSGGMVSVGQGSSGTSYVYVYSQYGFSGSVDLAVSGLPSGVTASFSPNPATLSGSMVSSMLTLTASNSAALGQYPLTITGTSGSLSATSTITVGVYTPSFTLSNFGSLDVGQGSFTTAHIYVNPQYGFSGSVTFVVSGLPSGVTALWNPNPATGSSALTLSASSSAPVGQYTLTVTGRSGSLSATTTIALGVYVPTFTLSSSYGMSVGQGTSATTYVNVYPQYGFTGSVNLSVSNLPNGVTATFTPNPTNASSSLTLTASSSATVGQYSVTIAGRSGTQSATTNLTFGVFVPTFTLSSYGMNIGQGTSGTTYVNVYPQYGFTGSVNLSISGLPSGVTATFSPNPTVGNSMLTLTASGTAAVGQYTITVTGTSGTQSATSNLTLGVYVPTFTLSSYGNVTLGQGSSTTSYVMVYPQFGFTGSVNLSVSGLPSGVTASFSPNPTSPNNNVGNSVLTLTASGTAALGQYTLIVTGTSGTQSATSNLTLGIYVPSFTLSSGYQANIGQGTSGTSYVSVYSQYGFKGSVSLLLSGLPSGVTAAFSPNPTTGNSTLTLTASSSASLGQYTLTITGTSGSLTAATTLILGIYAQSFTLYDSFSDITMNQGSSNTSYIFITPQYGFSGGVTLSASGLPSGVTASFTPNPANGTSSLTLTASNAATSGNATVTITGTSGSVTAASPISLIVKASTFTLLDAPGTVSLLRGNSAKSAISVVPRYGFVGSVDLVISGLPSGVTATISPNSTTGTSTLNLTASQSANLGSFTATITGTSGTLSAITPIVVNVIAAPSTTSTSVAITAGGSPVATVASNTPVTLTASVSSGSATLTTGKVNFCDAAATYCDQIHLLGSAQLTSAGTAVLKFIPGMGVHSYKAVFAGVNGQGVSSSSAVALTVTISQTSTTAIAQTGTPGNYTLAATVIAQGAVSPSGTVSFLDTTNANSPIGSAALAPGQTTFSSLNSQSLPTGVQPSSVAVGDFNGDGKPDLAVTNQGGNSVTILLGNGDGTLTASPSTLPTGNEPISVVVADFNGDGKPDLAVANANSSSVTIFLGNGDGTFAPTQLSPQTGSYPRSIAVGDFNGDGKPDLAVANESSNSVTVLLGNGDGTFTATSLSPQTGSYPEGLAVGDFNGDGIQDLAVANYSNNTVSILLGNGDGTFSTGISQPTGSSPQSIVVGDFNGDGNQDLAVANYYSSTLTILLGHGDGTFTSTATNPHTGLYPSSVVVADINGDGVQDLAVTNYFNSTVSILPGNGDGTFAAGASSSTGNSPASIAAADFDADGIPDLVAVNNAGKSVSILTTQLTQIAKASATGISPTGNGWHAVDASYAGDNNYKSSVSGTTQLSAQPAAPTVTVTPSSNGIAQSQALSVMVLVSGGTGTPTATGTVTLTSGSYSYGATTLNGGGATLIIPGGSLSIGSDTLTVSYVPDISGSSTYIGASGTATVSVTLSIAPTVTFTASNRTYGDATFTVSAISNSTGAITYSVVSGPATISGSTVTLTGAGTVVLQASQAAAGSYTAGTQTTSFTVAPGSQTISFAAPASPVNYGVSPISLSASSTSTLAVKFSVVSGPGSMSGSTLSITGVGTVVIAADQSGNANYTAASEVTRSIIVNKTAPPTGLTASPNPVLVQNAVILTATVFSAASTPTGSVVFFDGGTTIGTSNLTGGVATLTTAALAAGTHSLTAVYGGDGNFSSNSSVALAEMVQDFTLTTGGSGSSQTVQPGGTATFTLPMSPSGGTTFPTAVTLFASGLPTGFTATFSPSSLTVGSSAANVSMAIQVPLTAMLERSARPGRDLSLIALSMLMLPFVAGIKRSSEGLRRLALLAIVFAGISGMATFLTGCGGAGSGGGNSGGGSTPRVYTVTVTATSGALSHSTTATLTVQ